MTTHEPRVLDHDFDGIQEFDNTTPGWWNLLFWICVLVSAPYFYYYTFGVGERLAESYEAELAAAFEVQARQLGDLAPDAPTILRLGADPKLMNAGRALFRANCATCHAADGGGGTGPNLTDDAWINVRRPEDLFTTITKGQVAKGMPEWETRFGQAHRVLLAAYVASLRGSKPAAPKAPQGDPIPPWVPAP